MSWWFDIVDWLGGYPYEFASAGEVFQFCHGELGMQLEYLKSVSQIGQGRTEGRGCGRDLSRVHIGNLQDLVHFGFDASATKAGLYLLPSSITLLFAGPLAGLIGRRIGSKWPLTPSR